MKLWLFLFVLALCSLNYFLSIDFELEPHRQQLYVLLPWFSDGSCKGQCLDNTASSSVLCSSVVDQKIPRKHLVWISPNLLLIYVRSCLTICLGKVMLSSTYRDSLGLLLLLMPFQIEIADKWARKIFPPTYSLFWLQITFPPNVYLKPTSQFK